MTIEEARFKADYAKIKAKMKQIKQKLNALKKEAKPIAKAAYKLYERGDKTMYNEGKGGVITPKFEGLSTMMEDLEWWMGIDDEMQHVFECC